MGCWHAAPLRASPLLACIAPAINLSATLPSVWLQPPCAISPALARLLPSCPPLTPCSDYHYTQRMMSFAYDCFLPEGHTWRDLFDMVSGQQSRSS